MNAAGRSHASVADHAPSLVFPPLEADVEGQPGSHLVEISFTAICTKPPRLLMFDLSHVWAGETFHIILPSGNLVSPFLSQLRVWKTRCKHIVDLSLAPELTVSGCPFFGKTFPCTIVRSGIKQHIETTLTYSF